jgi:hypothetical protein
MATGVDMGSRNRASLVVCALLGLSIAPAQAFNPEGLLVRGDVNCDGSVAISDAVFVLNYLFQAGPGLPCPDAADANDDGRVNLSDPVWILIHLFRVFVLPEPEFVDPTPDGLGCRSGRPPCPRILGAERIGFISHGRVVQPSGVVVSRQDPDLLWVVNDFDSGRDLRLYALTRRGNFRGALELCFGAGACLPAVFDCGSNPLEVIHCDWEGLAIGRGADGGPALFVGDLGANRTIGVRTLFWIHRVPEPPPGLVQGDRTLSRADGDFETFSFRYPGAQSLDAEVLLCDPVTNDLYVITQLPAPSLYRYPGPLRSDEVVTLDLVTSVPRPDRALILSAGDISPDGAELVLKDTSDLSLFPWVSGDPAATFDPACACWIDLAEYLGTDSFHAGAVAFDAEGGILSLEELSFAEIFRLALDRR